MYKTKTKIKTIFSLMLAITLFTFVSLTNVQAQNYAANLNVEGTTSNEVNKEFTVEVYTNSSNNYNAVEMNVVLNNLTYISSKVNSDIWQGLGEPSYSGSTLTFIGAKLGSTITGKHLVISIVVKKPNTNSSSIVTSGKMSFPNADGTNATTVDAKSNTITIGDEAANNSSANQTAFILGTTLALILIGAGVTVLVLLYRRQGKNKDEDSVIK